MKSGKYFALLLTGLLFLLFSHTSFALPISGDVASMSYNGVYGGASGGGEFLVSIYDDKSDPAANETFISFCLEYSEHIYLNKRYDISGVDDYAVAGGGGATLEDGELRDYVSKETKWLMYNYLYGDYWFSRANAIDGGIAVANANSVQQVIWNLEEEVGWSSLSGRAGDIQLYLKTDEIMKSIAAFSFGDNVKVLNLTDGINGINVQSQLVAAPVPEPATMLLFGTGLVGLAGVARRRMRK